MERQLRILKFFVVFCEMLLLSIKQKRILFGIVLSWLEFDVFLHFLLFLLDFGFGNKRSSPSLSRRCFIFVGLGYIFVVVALSHSFSEFSLSFCGCNWLHANSVIKSNKRQLVQFESNIDTIKKCKYLLYRKYMRRHK